MGKLIWKYIDQELSFQERRELNQLLKSDPMIKKELDMALELDKLLKAESQDFPDQIVLCNTKSMIELELDYMEPVKFNVWKPIAWEVVIGAIFIAIGTVFFYSDAVMPSFDFPENYYQSLLMGTMIATTLLLLLTTEKILLKSKKLKKLIG